MKWFRFYHEALDDPKVQRLPGDLFKFWVNVLCLASRNEPRGVLPPVDEIAFALRLGDAETNRAVDELAARGLVETAEGRQIPHNWDARQYPSDDVNARVVKHRQAKHAEPSRGETLHATLHETPMKHERNVLDREENRGDGEEMRGDGETPRLRAVPKPKPSRVPSEFVISDEMRAHAVKVGVAATMVDAETEKFLDHFRATGKTMTDWPAAWRNWMRRAAEFAPSPRRSPNGKSTTALDRLRPRVEAGR